MVSWSGPMRVTRYKDGTASYRSFEIVRTLRRAKQLAEQFGIKGAEIDKYILGTRTVVKTWLARPL